MPEPSDTNQVTPEENGPVAAELANVANDPSIEEVLRDPELVELLKDSPEACGVLVRLIRKFEYSGPLPPASELEAYERVVPGSAERIVTWAEDEGKHRRNGKHHSSILIITALISLLSVFIVGRVSASRQLDRETDDED